MKSLIAFSCILAVALAKPDTLAYGSHLFTPASYSYSTYLGGSAQPLSTLAIPLAHSRVSHVIPEISLSAVDKIQYHRQNELGQAYYGHSEALQSHNALQDAAGNKMGSYSYIAPDGQIISANYIADNLGFRIATNGLPIGPTAHPVAPLETPEVQAARDAHFKAHEIAKSRTRRSVAVETPIGYTGLDISYPTPFVQPSTIPLFRNTPLATLTHNVPYLM